MRQLILLFLFSHCLSSCETKQWNLNKSIGWGSDNDFSYLLLKIDSSVLLRQSEIENIDKKVLSALVQKVQGEITEQDSLSGVRPIYVVSKDYKSAVKTILEVLESEGVLGKLKIVKRIYTSSTSWTEEVVFPSIH
jgi:hypothetical protein